MNMSSISRLINVSGLGKASQSSYSKWSKSENEAQLALQSCQEEFAFHTDQEEKPWWQVEFGGLIPVIQIVIHNRRSRQFWFKAKNLQVLISEDGESWKKIYQSYEEFGNDKNALVLQFEEPIFLKYLKLQSEKEYLHLCSIDVLVRESDAINIKPILLGFRSDGLMQRLYSIIQTMALADFCGYNFGFTWITSSDTRHNQFHDILDANLTFNKEFIEKHLFEKYHIDEFYRYNTKKVSILGYGEVFATHNPSNINKDFVLKKEYREYYNEIGFATDIMQARELASNIDLPSNAIAIHVRAGDVVYGEFRTIQAFIDKVLQFPFILDIINNFEHSQSVIVLFGQDSHLMDCIKKVHNNKVILASDYYSQDFKSIQKIFFDVELMSRCTVIYGGDSGPVKIANMIGNNTVHNLHNEMSQRDKLDILRTYLLDIEQYKNKYNLSDLQIAFAGSAYLYYGFNCEKIEDLYYVSKLTIASDTENNLYKVLNIILNYRVLPIKEAEDKVLEYILSSSSQSNRLGFASIFRDDCIRIIKKSGYMSSLWELVQNNNVPYANLILGLYYLYDKNHNMASFYFQNYKKLVDIESNVISNFLKDKM